MLITGSRRDNAVLWIQSSVVLKKPLFDVDDKLREKNDNAKFDPGRIGSLTKSSRNVPFCSSGSRPGQTHGVISSQNGSNDAEWHTHVLCHFWSY